MDQSHRSNAAADADADKDVKAYVNLVWTE
jgi:hypothetical protein